MRRLISDGTKYNDKLLNPMNLHGRFNISRELYQIENKLIIDLNEIKIFKETSIDPYASYYK